MINKLMKNSLYADILRQSTELLEEVQKEFTKEIGKTSSKEDESAIKAAQKGIIQSYQRIRNNAFLMLIKNEFKFYTGTDDWKSAKTMFLDLNGTTYTIDLQSARTLLSNEAETVLDSAFSKEPVENQIDLSVGEEFDFQAYAKENGKKREILLNMEPKTEPQTLEKKKPDSMKESNKQVEKKDQKRVADASINKKTDSKKERKERQDKPGNRQENEKGLKNQGEQAKVPNQKQQEKKKRKTEPVAPVSVASDLEEFFMNEDEITITAAAKPLMTEKQYENVTEPKTGNGMDVKQAKSDVKNPKANDNIKTVEQNIQLRQDPTPDTEADARPANVQKEEVDEPMALIENDGISITEISSPSVDTENPVNILVEELIMDIYTVKMQDDNVQNGGNEKVFTIIVAPASSGEPENSVFVPTFAFARSGKNICTCATVDKIRPSYQILLDNESFFVRGGWNQEGFFSLLYPQNTGNEKVTIQKRQIKPSSEKNIGHNVVRLDNGIKIHILPLSSKNSQKGWLGVLVCLEDPIGKKYIPASTKERAYVDIHYNGIVYRITALWEGKKLISDVQIL